MRVPVIVLTGFLGAGKTTLLNELLRRRANRNAPGKVGVVVNELGEVGIDGALLSAGTDAKQIELPGGCVCCVMGNDLGVSLVELIDSTPGIDSIILETTGVAEPIGIAWALQAAGVADRVRLAAVVTLVDTTNFIASRPVSVAVDAQVAYADICLVTKAPLAEGNVASVLAAIETLAPRALVEIRDTAGHAAYLDELLTDPDLERANEDPGEPNHVHDDTCRHSHSHAAHGIDSVWVAADAALDIEELEDQLAALPSNYVRIKGIVRDPAGAWVVVHRVGPRVSSEPIETPKAWQPRIVALGPSVDAAPLAACVAAAAQMVG